MFGTRALVAVLSLCILTVALNGASAQEAPPPNPLGNLAADPAASPGAGFIHGTVTWPSGEAKTGYLRWKDEEAYWDDLFHCGYRDLVWAEYVDLDRLRAERRAEYFRTHGLFDRLAYALDSDGDNPVGWRMFLSRFGDMRGIEIRDGEDDFAITAEGGRHQIGGYANDAGATLLLYVAGEEKPERIRWNDLTGILFSPAPADFAPYAERLYGRVQTAAGEFEGYIQWDKSENTSIDILDGENETGEVDLEMGEIRSLTRTRDNKVDAILKDGREMRLEGTNDVDSGNRGLLIEVADLGKVTVPWNRFDSIEFLDGYGSGSAREAYANGDPLRGRLTTTDGRELAGRLVFDLDEAWRWDLFNGQDGQDLEYDIPFHRIREIRALPTDDPACRVTLVSGRTLDLAENQDTGAENGGILVFESEGADPEHVLWMSVDSIEFTR